jgi:hypothetical protein
MSKGIMHLIQLSEYQSSVFTQSHSEVDVVDAGGTRIGHIKSDANLRAMEQPNHSQRSLPQGSRKGSAQEEAADVCVLSCVWGSWEEE